MNDRFKKLMLHYNMSPSNFADEIGVNRPGISHIISGRNKPGVDLIQKVLKRFPEVSTDWLLMGIGSMLHVDNDGAKIHAEPAETKAAKKPIQSLFQIEEEQEIPEEKIVETRQEQPKKHIEIQATSRIKRITVYYQDGSFEDFSS